VNILLIQPPKAARSLLGDEYYMFEPLSLEYLAAGVDPAHQVRLLDMRIEPDLDAALESFRPDVVGVTAYTVHVNATRDICRRVKAWRPDALTVVGGHHATVRPEDFAREGVDLVVAGEGVSAFREIIDRRGDGGCFDGIPGVFQVRGEGLAGEPAPVVTDLDGLPLPDRNLSARYRDRYFCEWMKPLATIRTSKGCPFRCSFCALWRLTDGRYLKRSPESVVAELRTISEPNVFFADDESMINVQGLDRLADLIAQEGIHKNYFLYGRSDTIVRHPELIRKWRSIGLARVFIGLEFFRDSDLAGVNKRTSIAENEQAVRILEDLGIEAHVNFMVLPSFSREDFREFRRYCRSLPLSFAGFSVLTPLPGTQLFEERNAELITRDWDCFDFLHTVLPTRLPLEAFYAEYADLIRHAVSPRRSFAFLRKCPLREIPGVIRNGGRLLGRIRGAHRDHAGESALGQAPGN
jgi:radical SAM superfamily enzyme YgiQ (UPF0313 family)